MNFSVKSNANQVAASNLTNFPFIERKIKLQSIQLYEFSVKSDANQAAVFNFTKFSVKSNANQVAAFNLTNFSFIEKKK